jgi:lipoprotein LprG
MTTTAVRGRAPLRRGWSAAAVALVLLALPLTACSQDDGEGSDPQAVLEEAREQLDETSGVELSLTTEQLPDGVDGVVAATGTLTDAPAFDGTLKARASNLTADVPVISVDGVVYAKVPFSTKMARINPADYGAPDPALLMDSEVGLTAWLTEATGLETGDQSRDGDTVLTEYSGTLPGEVVARTIPSADPDGDFPATFSVDDDGRLQKVAVSGPFYGPDGEVDYTVDITEYDVEADIRRP